MSPKTTATSQAAELLRLTRMRGVTLTSVGTLLRIAGPPGQVDRFRPAIAALKADLIALLQQEAEELAASKIDVWPSDEDLAVALTPREYFRQAGYGSIGRYRQWQDRCEVGVPLPTINDKEPRKTQQGIHQDEQTGQDDSGLMFDV